MKQCLWKHLPRTGLGERGNKAQMSFKGGERHGLHLTLGKLFNISKPTLFYFLELLWLLQIDPFEVGRGQTDSAQWAETWAEVTCYIQVEALRARAHFLFSLWHEDCCSIILGPWVTLLPCWPIMDHAMQVTVEMLMSYHTVRLKDVWCLHFWDVGFACYCRVTQPNLTDSVFDK